MNDTESSVVPARWIGEFDNGYLEMLDQSRLPERKVWLVIADAEDVFIHLAAGAIGEAVDLGTAAAYALALEGRDVVRDGDDDGFVDRLETVADRLREARPDADELDWALDRIDEVVADGYGEVPTAEFVDRMFDEARTIAVELSAEN